MFLRTQRRHIRGWRCALALTIACTSAGPTFAQQPAAKAQIEAVFKDWQYRQSVFKSARYVLAGTTEFKDKKLPPGSPIRPYHMVLLLDFAKKRYHLESAEEIICVNGKDDPKEWEWQKRIHTSAYDGEALQHLTHRKANRISEEDRPEDLSIGKGNLGIGAQFGAEVWPIFFAHGIVPTVHDPLLVDKLPLNHDPDDFEVLGRQIHRGQTCLLMRTEPSPGPGTISDEFWINQAQKSTIPHYVYLIDSSIPWLHLDISWKNTAHGWWVDQWSETSYISGEVRRINRFRVESFEADREVSDRDFNIPVEPGMIVKVSEIPPPEKGLNPFLAASSMYRISPSGSWDEISAEGFTTLEGNKLPPERHWRWIAWTIAGALAIGILLLYVLFRRRRMAAL